MEEQILDTLANVGIALAGFSGVVAAFRLFGERKWSVAEIRVLWFLISDSFLVLFFSLLPFPLALANWSPDAIWGLGSALLGTYFILGNVWALLGQYRDRKAKQLVTVPVITRIINFFVIPVAFVMGIVLWLSAFDVIIPRGQAAYVVGLIVLLAFAAVEFLFFIGHISRQENEIVENGATDTRK